MERLELNEYKELPFGENTHQQAGISAVSNGIEYEILSDNAIEYIDYLNLTRVLEILSEFFDVNACAVAKDNLLSSVALGHSIENAFEKILENDSLTISDGTIGFTKEVSLEVAKQLNSMRVRNVVSSKFSKEALTYLCDSSELNVIVIKSPLQELLGLNNQDVKLTPFGYLVQEQNLSKLTKSSFKVAGKVKPTQQQAEDAIFAWKVAKYTKTHCAIIAKDLATKAIVQSGQNKVLTVENAMDYACESSKDAVLAVDGVIESESIVNTAIQGRISLIIEAGDGKISDKTIKLTDKYNIALIQTGIRNYKY
jgi:phosphoribosylaminoimidazolecarboxamide formyltransferase/IMP cyclohydrolase